MELADCPSSQEPATQPSCCYNPASAVELLAFRLDSSPAFGDSEG